MTKWRGQVASIAPGLLSVSVLALTAGLASAQTTISAPITGPQVISEDEDVTVTTDGSVALVGESDEAVIEIDVVDYTSDVLNQGTLSYRGGEADSTAQGILLTGGLSGALTNEGLIELDVSDDDDVTLYGIEVEGDVSGTITNRGTIDVYGAATDDFVSVVGINVEGKLTGTIQNDGVIVVEAREITETAFAGGIYVESIGAPALIENNGTIEARASTFTDSEAGAFGIEVDGDLLVGAQIVNNGVILAEAESVSYSAYARGILVEDGIDGSVLNTGSITASVDGVGTDADTVDALGISVGGDLSGSLSNEGTIEATAQSLSTDDTAEAYGIEIDGDIVDGGRLLNTGTIVASATSFGGIGSVAASGIEFDDLFGTLINDGTMAITVTAVERGNDTSMPATAHGIEGEGLGATGTLTNSGTISVTATASRTSTGESLYARANGILVDAADGALTNSGTITVSAKADGSGTLLSASAYGIETGDVSGSGSIDNSGTISATAAALGTATSESLYASANGILVNAADGAITNSGTISVSATADGSGESGLLAYAYGINTWDVSDSIDNSGTISASATAEGTATSELFDAGNSTTAASSGPGIFASAVGIDAGDVSGSITNSGTISAWATAEGTATSASATASSSGPGILAGAFGIAAGGVSGSITNSGTISASATADGSGNRTLAGAIGIEAGDVSGSIDNSGTISASATADGLGYMIGADAYGIDTGDVSGSGSIGNSGTISASATADGSGSGIFASIYGIEAGDVSGSIDNSGTISASATADGLGYMIGADAFGIRTSDVSGSITNSGTIRVTATALETDTSEPLTSDKPTTMFGSGYGIRANAVGIDVDIDLATVDGSIDNSGTISVSATADGSGESGLLAGAYGINMWDVSGSIDNSGTISASATAEGTATSELFDAGNSTAAPSPGPGILAGAYGIDAGDVSGSITNSGTISASATADGSGNRIFAGALGIAAGDVFGSIDNTGTISATAMASGTATSDLDARVYGIAVGAIDGTITNSGTVSVIATADGSAQEFFVNAYGIYAGPVAVTGSLSNTGLIMASAEVADGGKASAFGMYTETLDGTLFNSGSVIAEAANGGQSFAVQVEGGSGEATFQTTSRFVGSLSLQNAALTVESVPGSGSIFWTFDDIPDTVKLDQLGGPTLYRDDKTIATVAPANLPLAGQVAGEVAALGFDAVTALMAGVPSTGVSVTRMEADPVTVSTSGMTAGDRLMFVQGEFISRDMDDAVGRPLGMDLAGITAGMVGTLSNGMGYGATLSGYSADGSVVGPTGPDTIDSSGIALGVYGNTGIGAANLTFGASFGAQSNDSIRSVNDNTAPGGIATFNGEYNSHFVSPAVELSYVMQSGGATFRPYVGYRYTHLSVDGFTEEGFGGATYAGRDVGVSDIRVGLDRAMSIGNGTLTGSMEILNRNAHDPGTNTVLFGINGNTTASATDFTAVELGIGYGIEIGQGRLDISGSTLVGGDSVSGFGVTAGYRIAF